MSSLIFTVSGGVRKNAWRASLESNTCSVAFTWKPVPSHFSIDSIYSTKSRLLLFIFCTLPWGPGPRAKCKHFVAIHLWTFFSSTFNMLYHSTLWISVAVYFLIYQWGGKENVTCYVFLSMLRIIFEAELLKTQAQQASFLALYSRERNFFIVKTLIYTFFLAACFCDSSCKFSFASSHLK